MCADRSSPGIRALLGRFLHGLLQSRVFQLLAAAWSYVMGLSGASLFSFLPSAWVVHRSVGPDELPEMLEALGLRSAPWEELGECLEELGPWKELLSPAMKADLGMPSAWAGYAPSSKEQESWDSDLEELGTWHSTMWAPGLGTWKEMGDPDQEEDQCHSKSSVNTSAYIHHKVMSENGLCDGDDEKNGARLHPSPLSMVSCIFNPGSGGVFTWLELGNEHNLQNKDLLDETFGLKEEIEHIRNKRLWFLQQNQDVSTTDPKEEENIKAPVEHHVHHESVLSDPPPFIKIDVPVSDWHDGHKDDQLMSDYELSQCNVPESHPVSKPCPPLSLLVPKPFISGNAETKYPPSPDQDQGYHSLEDWQCLNIKLNLQSGGISPSNICEVVRNGGGALVPTELSPTELSCTAVKDLGVDQDSDDLDSDLEEETHAPAPPVCTNKHIGYILGTIESDDEEEDPSSCEDDWDDDDDGFDSEGSVSAAEINPPAPEEAVLWNAFCSTDPYNPQNFTASLQTGPIAEVTGHLEDQEAVISDEESWCDSDAVSDSDSEDEFSADEQENLKLWNGFLRSEDPYNPLYFKASVQTSQRTLQNIDSVPKHSVCTSVSTCELTVPTHPSDSPLLRLRKKHSVSMEESANAGRHKKVTFCDKVTVHYVCNEEERKGHWEEFARDRCRFHKRIQETQCVIGHCFTPDHRQRVWNRMQEIWGS